MVEEKHSKDQLSRALAVLKEQLRGHPDITGIDVGFRRKGKKTH